jgi:hypothetical protein
MAAHDCRTIVAKEKKLNVLLRGRTAQILSDYNDQPYGTSKKSLRATIQVVERVIIEQTGISVKLEGHRLFIDIQELRFIS